MSTLPPGLTQADIETYAKIDDGMKRLQDAKDELNEKIKLAHKGVGKGTYIYGEVVVKIGATSKTDYKAIGTLYGEGDYPEYYESKLATTKIPKEIKAVYTEQVPTLSVTRSA